MKCEHCGKHMTERHVVDNVYYCSAECAIDAIMDDIITNAKEKAKETYHECVEIIPPTITRCKYCNTPLALNETAWSSIDGMYCSHSCGVADACTKYDASEYTDKDDLVTKATQYFEDVAEEISREDYGVTEVLYVEWAPTLGRTLIFRRIVENDEVISRELVGYVNDRISNEDAAKYVGKLKYIYVD